MSSRNSWKTSLESSTPRPVRRSTPSSASSRPASTKRRMGARSAATRPARADAARSGAGPRRSAPPPDRPPWLPRAAGPSRVHAQSTLPRLSGFCAAQSCHRRNARRRRSPRTAPAVQYFRLCRDSNARAARNWKSRSADAHGAPAARRPFRRTRPSGPRRARRRRRSARPRQQHLVAQPAVLVHLQHVDGDVRRRPGVRSSRAIRASSRRSARTGPAIRSMLKLRMPAPRSSADFARHGFRRCACGRCGESPPPRTIARPG